MSQELSAITVSDVEKMAHAVASSRLFGISTPEQAMSLMLIAQAEGTHPALAARDYHIIQGKPALKADAMLARFQQAGGRVDWQELTDNRVCATFTHPSGGSATIDWDMNRARAAQLGGKDMWKKFPRQMLRARVISEGIRTVFPGVVIGVYTPEEVQDFDDKPRPMQDVTPPKTEQATVSGSAARALCERLDAAREFISNAKTEKALRHITDSANYKRLLNDLDGSEDKAHLMNLLSEKFTALMQPQEPDAYADIPEYMNHASATEATNV